MSPSLCPVFASLSLQFVVFIGFVYAYAEHDYYWCGRNVDEIHVRWIQMQLEARSQPDPTQ